MRNFNLNKDAAEEILASHNDGSVTHDEELIEYCTAVVSGVMPEDLEPANGNGKKKKKEKPESL